MVAILAIVALASARPSEPEPELVRVPRSASRATTHALLAGQTIDLNQAAPADLVLLPGVGPKLAERIVAERQRRGGFSQLEDLRAVRGIGPATLARLSPLVRVDPPAQRSNSSEPDNASVR
ncbi:MAG TPA: helix-hairpin-helix domain-containing protein [Polyangiales bacterium]|nr:helix-hairpin-helix domain-containing protein [Polyangiales bacterium]